MLPDKVGDVCVVDTSSTVVIFSVVVDFSVFVCSVTVNVSVFAILSVTVTFVSKISNY